MKNLYDILHVKMIITTKTNTFLATFRISKHCYVNYYYNILCSYNMITIIGSFTRQILTIRYNIVRIYLLKINLNTVEKILIVMISYFYNIRIWIYLKIGRYRTFNFNFSNGILVSEVFTYSNIITSKNILLSDCIISLCRGQNILWNLSLYRRFKSNNQNCLKH